MKFSIGESVFVNANTFVGVAVVSSVKHYKLSSGEATTGYKLTCFSGDSMQIFNEFYLSKPLDTQSLLTSHKSIRTH